MRLLFCCKYVSWSVLDMSFRKLYVKDFYALYNTIKNNTFGRLYFLFVVFFNRWKSVLEAVIRSTLEHKERNKVQFQRFVYCFVKSLMANATLTNRWQRTSPFYLSCHKICYWRDPVVAGGSKAFYSSAALPVQICVKATSTSRKLT